MPTNIQTIKNFPQLIKYLRTDLGWPVDEEDAENLTFDYDPEELGLDEKAAVKVRAAKQLRPLTPGQPWGIFWIDFEPKKLPVTVMRRILNQLVAKKRGAKSSSQATWNLDDLLFISAVGSEKSDQREITFAHFHQDDGDLPTLRVLGWDGADTVLKIDHVAKTLKEKLLWPQNPKDVKTWRETWAEAFKHKPGHVIRTADALAERLAELARNIRAAAQTIMEHETEKGRLRKLHKAFQTALIHDLSEEDFADTYAQTITYGLLTAAISRTDMSGGAGTALVAENITDMVPVTNPFLREMLETFLHAGGRRANTRDGIDFDELGIQDVVELLRSDETDLPAILRDFNNRAEGEDPVIRFYEDFLAAYDKALKVQRGVFYTPKPVVSYIVRGVHELLQTEFGLDDGLADTTTWGEMTKRNASIRTPKGVAPTSHFVTILDPATGTATFLVEVIDVIYKTMVAKWKKQGKSAAQIQAAWNEYVPTALLPRLYGYELMMAPYAIAHMKIGLKLYETGYRFASDQRANIYLTNALEEPSQLAKGAASLFEALGHEADAVNNVKRGVHFTVVIGNPPYSNFGMMNKNEWILKLLDDYKQGLSEKKINLDDDFIKFVRLAQWNIDKAETGILGYITNNTYIDGITHRRMRENILESFSKLHIVNLRGSIYDISPNNIQDENVFDIQQGVSISFFIKTDKQKEGASSKAYYSDIWGNRVQKYEILSSNKVLSTTTEQLSLKSPNFFFIPREEVFLEEYEKFPKVSEFFVFSNSALQTKKDSLSIHFDIHSLNEVLNDLRELDAETLRDKYEIGPDGRDWGIQWAKQDVIKNKGEIFNVIYRPFDIRWSYFTGKSKGFLAYPRADLTENLLKPNLALATMRQIAGVEDSCEVLVTHFAMTDRSMFSTHGTPYIFPLYLYPSSTGKQKSLFETDKRKHNFSSSFIDKITKITGMKFVPDGCGDLITTYGPENIFHYMYAVFHSPTYRSRYAEFLKIDFPRLPLTRNVKLFRQLCGLGDKLVALHLMESTTLNKPINKFTGKGDNVIAKGYPKYQNGVVLINPSQGFENIPEEVWEFHVGGYQVCEKWLKDRRERELSAKDIEHYQKVVVSLKETIRLMQEVDKVIDVNGGWPIK